MYVRMQAIQQCPVRRTANFDTNSDCPGIFQPCCNYRAKIFISIARHSFIQLGELRRRGESEMVKLRNCSNSEYRISVHDSANWRLRDISIEVIYFGHV